MIPGILAVIGRAVIGSDGIVIVLPVGERPPLDADALRAAGRGIAVLQEVRSRLAPRVTGLVVNVIRRAARMIIGDAGRSIIDFRDGSEERLNIIFRDLRRGDLALAAHSFNGFVREIAQVEDVVPGIVIRERNIRVFNIVVIRDVRGSIDATIADAYLILFLILGCKVVERDGR